MKNLWKTLGLIFLLILNIQAFGQHTLRGILLGKAERTPLVGANVVLQNTTKGDITNVQGEFQLSDIPEGEYQLSISMIGYETLTQNLRIDSDLNLSLELTEKATVLANTFVYAMKDYPITKTEVDAEKLEKRNLGQDLPALLNYEPSVVFTSDAGAGVGYTGVRIRGSDAQRINVTVNGIPLNDSESHGVFWVNMPDFTSSVQNISIQRGVGTSVNGAGAFGASINVETEKPGEERYIEVNNSYGSFNTWRHNLAFGTGLINQKFSLEGRLSKISSNGFVDRSSADLKSFFVSGSYHGENSKLTFNAFSGQETTQQAWWGTPEAKLNGDAEGIESYILNNGLNEAQAENIRNSGNRTYNFYIYDNETDNYQQDHYQLLYDFQLGRWKGNAALHYTRGRGYFEQAVYDGALADVGLDSLKIGGDTILQSDYIVQRWLDNHFYGTVFSMNYQSEAKKAGTAILDVVVGGGWNEYDGDHYGEIIWAEYAVNTEINQRYYDGNGLKQDFNVYGKMNYQPLDNLFLFADLQLRTINYKITGTDNTLRDVSNTDDFVFFNPKAGLTYYLGNNRFSASFAIANKEPIRSDYTDAVNGVVPEHETLRNIEVGYAKTWQRARIGVNYYLMDYKNQLIPTGQVNDVGAAIRTNIPRSYRTGIELEGKLNVNNKLSVAANTTFSQNKNRDFTEFIINFDDFSFINNELGDTDIALSPNIIAGSELIYEPIAGLELSWLSKYVGKQYLDNTQNDDRAIDPYFVNDVRIGYSFSTKYIKKIGVNLLVNNIFNTEFESNGYTYAYSVGGSIVRENHFFPQAGTHFLLGLKVRL